MAYFANGSEGAAFEIQCQKCVFGEKACPIALAQMVYNYDACNNEVAREILDTLVTNDGTCNMYKIFKDDLDIKLRQSRIEAACLANLREKHGQLSLEDTNG